MKCRFNQIVEELLGVEGSFVNNPNDNGGATKWGITLSFYQSYVDQRATVETIRNLSKTESKQIYEDHFWLQPYFTTGYGYDDLPLGVGSLVMNASVNMGWKQSHKLLQMALSEMGYSVRVDGWIGPSTMGAIDKADPEVLVGRMAAEMCRFYSSLVYVQDYGESFYDGWLYRAISGAMFSVKMM